MKNKFLYVICFLALSAAPGCDKHPADRLVDPTSSNITGVWSGKWVLYDDEIKTNGAQMPFNEGATQDFRYTDNPRSGKMCIRYSWDGSPVLTFASLPLHPDNYLQSDFVGFSLICAKTTAGYAAGAKDLSAGGFKSITFWARGSLHANVYLRVEANSIDPNVYLRPNGYTGVWMGTVTPGWVQYGLNIDKNVNNLTAATDFVKFILRYDEDGDPSTANTGRGNGGTVFLDDIELSSNVWPPK